MTAKKSTNAPRAAYAEKPVTPLINAYCDWIEREVGIKLDADARRSVYLGSALRTEFQKANRESRDAAGIDDEEFLALLASAARKRSRPPSSMTASRP